MQIFKFICQQNTGTLGLNCSCAYFSKSP